MKKNGALQRQEWAKWILWSGLASVLIFLVPVYYTSVNTASFGLYHDDGLYLVVAKSLADNGTYSITSLPEPIPQSKYPFLYSWLLGLFLKLKPDVQSGIWLLKCSSLVWAVLWYGLIYCFLRRRHSPVMCCTALAFVMLSHWSIFLSSSLLPDVLFSLLCLSSLLLMDDSGGRAARWRYAAMAAITASAAFLVSTKGVTVLVAGSAFFLMKRRWKELMVFGAIAGMLCLPWILWQRGVAAPDDPVLQYYSKASYSSGHIFGNLSARQATTVVCRNIVWTATGFVDLMLGISGPSVLLVILGIGLSLAAAGGFWSRLRFRINASELWFGVYIAMLLCWVWPPSRYLVPVLPLFLGYVVTAAATTAVRIPVTLKPKFVVASLTITFVIVGASTSYRVAQLTRERNSLTLAVEGGPEDWPAIQAGCAWIRENTAPQAVVATNLDPLVYLLSGRKSVRAFVAQPYSLCYAQPRGAKPLGTVEGLRDHFLRNRVTHVLLTRMDGYAEAPYFYSLLGQLIHRYPGSVRVAKIWKETGTQVWTIDQSKLALQTI